MTEQEIKDTQNKHDMLRVEPDKLYGADYALTLKDLYAVNQIQSAQNSIDAFKKISDSTAGLDKISKSSKLNAITQAVEDINLHKHIFEATSNPELIGNSLIMGVDIGKEKKAYDNIGSIMGADVLASALPAESSKPWILNIGERVKPKHTFETASNLESINKAWLSSSAVSQLKSATDYLSPIKEVQKALSQVARSDSIAEMVKNSASHNIKHEVAAAEIAAKEWGELAKTDYLKQFGADDYTTTQLQSVQNSINAFKKATESVGGYNKILELAKNSVAPFSYAEEAIKNLNQHKHIFEAAGNLESINIALMSSSSDYLSPIQEAEKVLSRAVQSDSITEMVKNSTLQFAGVEESFKPENFDFLQKEHHDTYIPIPRTFEIPENPMPKQLGALIERADNQLELQKYHFEEQLKQSDRQHKENIEQQQRQFQEQFKLSEKQHNERIEQQQRQIENSEKDSKKAMWVARVSIVVSIVVSILSVIASFYIYYMQDESDEKNHREINQALNKIADSVINLNTQQSENNNKLLEAIKKQKGKNER